MKINKSSRPRLKYQLTAHSEQQKLEMQFQCLLTLQINNQHTILYTSKTLQAVCDGLMLATPALVRLRQEEGKFQASLDYVARLSQKTQKTTWRTVPQLALFYKC